MISVVNIINTISSKILYLRTLDHVVIDKETIRVGNNAVTARCTIPGREGKWLFKCYYRKKTNLRQIYDEAYYPDELSLYSIDGRMESTDVVVMPWIEGKTLDSYIGDRDSDYSMLSREFDILAYNTLTNEYAHGDIKPDNIVVLENHEMRLIDFDGMWTPSHRGHTMSEIGTQTYRHPRRDSEYSAKSIDDYPIALISTMLAALAHDRETMERYIKIDGSMFDPLKALRDSDEALKHAKQIFKEHNDAAHYRIATGLHAPYPTIYNLAEYMRYALHPTSGIVTRDCETERKGTLWGLKRGEEWVIAPLYDMCEMLRHGACLIVLGGKRIYLNIEGEELPDIDKLERNVPNEGKRWSMSEDTELANMLFDGRRLTTIARRLGRSTTAVRARITKLKLPISELNRGK